jgi:hypothetical protein
MNPQTTERMTAEEFSHHTYSVTSTLGWTWIGGDNVMIGPNGKRWDWPSDIAACCAVTRLPGNKANRYADALPANKPWETWTYVDRLRAFSVAVGRPWGGAR